MAVPLVAGIAGIVSGAVTSIVSRFASTATTLAVLGVMQKAVVTWALFILAPVAFVGVVMYFMSLIIPWVFSFILTVIPEDTFPDMVLTMGGPAAYLLAEFRIPQILALLSSALMLRFFLRLFRVV